MVRGAYGIFYQRDTMDYWILQAFNPPFVRTGDVTLSVNAQSIQNFPVDDLTPVVNFVTPGSKPAPTVVTSTGRRRTSSSGISS